MYNVHGANSDYMTLPNGYEIRKTGATYNIYDEESGECLSRGYHTINYPYVKIGAHREELMEYKGYLCLYSQKNIFNQ